MKAPRTSTQERQNGPSTASPLYINENYPKSLFSLRRNMNDNLSAESQTILGKYKEIVHLNRRNANTHSRKIRDDIRFL